VKNEEGASGMDNLGDRMKKNYEDRYRFYLTRRVPVIIRPDGRAFHTLTKNCEKPFDRQFCNRMDYVAIKLMEGMQGAKCAYVQSDEISILLTDFDTLTTDAWFNYNVQKMASVSAGMASALFTRVMEDDDNIATFDSRVFNVPKEEVANYFVWRQKDWIRNSVSMLALSYYSHKELHKKNQKDMHEMLHIKGVNWADIRQRYKNGCFIYRELGSIAYRYDVIFTEERNCIERCLGVE